MCQWRPSKERLRQALEGRTFDTAWGGFFRLRRYAIWLLLTAVLFGLLNSAVDGSDDRPGFHWGEALISGVGFFVIGWVLWLILWLTAGRSRRGGS